MVYTKLADSKANFDDDQRNQFIDELANIEKYEVIAGSQNIVGDHDFFTPQPQHENQLNLSQQQLQESPPVHLQVVDDSPNASDPQQEISHEKLSS